MQSLGKETEDKKDNLEDKKAESPKKDLPSWAQKLKRYNTVKPHKTPAENDREADVEFLKLLEEEKNTEESANPSFKTIPKFFFKKPSNENSIYFRTR